MSRYDLNGKVALVTGAARGIGFETARQMHLRGASVAVLDLNADEAREAAERIGPRAIGLGADVTDQGAMLAAVAAVVEQLRRARRRRRQRRDRAADGDDGADDAGRGVEAGRRRQPDRRLAHRAGGAAADRPSAAARSSSSAPSTAFANGLLASPYAVSKAGVEALGRALRAELAPLGASASVVYFGWVDTDLVRDSLDRRTTARPRILGRSCPPSC